MTLDWLDRAVFREFDLGTLDPAADVADAADLGVTALWLTGAETAGSRLRGIAVAARTAELRSCVALSAGTIARVDRVTTAIEGWLEQGVDAVALPAVAAAASALTERFAGRVFVAESRDWRTMPAGPVPCVMSTAGTGDVVERQIVATAVLTKPALPLVDPTAAADRAELRHHVEQLVYLRVAEADLACTAAFEPVNVDCGPDVAVYRRGEALLVVLNAGATAHRPRVEHVGDLTPVLGHHCEAHHDAHGWWLRVGPRSFGVFLAR